MSAFLGPIHYWLYNKIKLQNRIVEEILQLGYNKYGEDKFIGINEFGSIPDKNLEEIIDVTNIHGWLQECVSTVEYRLAFVTTKMINEDSYNLEILKTLFYELGRKSFDLPSIISISEAYKMLNDTLLDGMPCDHANSVVEENANSLVYKRNLCVHQKYWDAVGGDIKNYYIIREQFIKGLFDKTNVEYGVIAEDRYQLVTNE